jgi:hypothetical protein
MLVTIRPNLNKKPLNSIHRARLGKVLEHREQVSIRCSSVVVRTRGQELAEKESQKTVHAGLIGDLLDTVYYPSSESLRVTYNPHLGDRCFYVNGRPYDGGGIVTAIGWDYYLI